MGLLVECPECKKRNSQKAKVCKCGFALVKFSGRVWWIEWYQDGYRKRERIGSSKAAAEHRMREIKSALAEHRHIQKSPDISTRFKDLAQWYLELPEVKAKASYGRDKDSLKHLLSHFGDRLLKDINPTLIEAFRYKRLEVVKPATVNREIACFRTIFRKAIENGKAERYPLKGVKMLKENNERDRLLNPDEYVQLLAHSPAHLKTIIKIAYHSAMRRGEILGLTWEQIDLREGFIRLEAEHCKNNKGRLVPLHPDLIEMFKAMPRGLPGVRVFTRLGKPIRSIREAFTAACQKAGIKGLTFHDLRHTAINNWRLQGHDYFRIMAASGHKTMTVFKRYNTVSKDELKSLVGGKIGTE